MKICPECERKNTDTATLCGDCGALLNKVAIENYEKRMRHEAAIRERRERRLAFLRRAGLIAAVAVWLALAVSGFVTDGMEFLAPFLFGCFIIGMGCINLAFPEALFRLNHMCSIRNVDEVELSDFYYFTNTIGSIVCIIIGIAHMAGWIIFS